MSLEIELDECIDVPRSAQDCFLYLRDFSTVEQWDPGVARARKLTPGLPGVGSEFHVQLNTPLGPSPMLYRLTEVRENSGVRLSGQGKDFSAVDTIDIEAIGAFAARIRYRACITFERLPPSLRWVVQPWMDRMGARAVQGLQTALMPDVDVSASWGEHIADRLLVPAALNFTQRGYQRMPNKGLSQRLDGQCAVVTGATSGLGLAAACELARLGARVILLGRDSAKLAAACREVVAFADGRSDLAVPIEADVSDLDQLRRAAFEILDQHPSIDILINNAGILNAQRDVSAQGFEQSLAVNLLAPWLLTHMLAGALDEAGGRVIQVASGGQYLQPMNLRSMNSESEKFDGTRAYAQAKRALIYASQWMNRSGRLGRAQCWSMHPGWAATPGVARSLPGFNRALKGQLRDARMGCDTAVWLASCKTRQSQTDALWFDRKPHAVDVLPTTAASQREIDELIGWLDEVCLTARGAEHGSKLVAQA